MHRSLLPTALVTAAASFALAGSAAAATVSYEAIIAVDYSYEYAQHEQSTTPGHAYSRNEQGSYSGSLLSINPYVQFQDGKLLPYRAGNGGFTARTEGSARTTIHDEWSGDSAIDCKADGQEPYRQGRSSLGPTGLNGDSMGVRIFETLEIPQTCTARGTSHTQALGLHNEGAEDTESDFEGPFDAIAPWSPDTVGAPPGAGKIVQHIKSEPSDAQHCPGEDDSETFTSCVFQYEGTITYVRQDLAAGTEDPTLPPAPPQPPAPSPDASEDAMVDAVSDAIRDHLNSTPTPAPVPVPAPAPAPAPTGNPMVDSVSDAIRKYLQDARVSVDGNRARVDVTCPGACTGTLSAEAVARANIANGTPLGRAVFIELGSTRAATATQAQRMRATIRLSPADRRALRKRPFVALRMAVTPNGAAKPTVVRRAVRTKAKAMRR